MIVAFIPAKGDSKRLSKKNLLLINGKSLVDHAIQYARKSSIIEKIYVSTDSEEIAISAKKNEVEVIMRDSSLGDETPLIEVYKHAWKKIDNSSISHVVCIQPDNPDRKTNIDEAIEYVKNKNIDNMITVDSEGKHNGAINILSRDALISEQFIYASTLLDNCTNIHCSLDYYLAKKRMQKSQEIINVENKRIGEKQSTFIVAEAACNHMCNMDLAIRMIDEAASAGADAIKFQTYKSEKLVSKDAQAFWGTKKTLQKEYYKKLDHFGKEEYAELFSHAKEKGIVAFSSPFDIDSVELLNELGMSLYKIASCEINNIDFLKQISRIGTPIILSTGASTIQEIDKAIETIFSQNNDKLMLLACTLSYPTKYHDSNILRVNTLKERYRGIIVGISDHTEPDESMVIPALAVAIGAKIVEKHYTLDTSMEGSGHFFSVDPKMLKKMVNNIRLAELTLGDGSLGVNDSEVIAWEKARRTIVSNKYISVGTKITENDICFKRADNGISIDRISEVVGRKTKVNISDDIPIMIDMLEKLLH